MFDTSPRYLHNYQLAVTRALHGRAVFISELRADSQRFSSLLHQLHHL